jgi:aminopeptidase N
LAGLPDPLARSVCWQALADGVARGVVDPRVYVSAVERSWPRESHPALVNQVALSALSVIRWFIPESFVPRTYARIHEAAGRAFDASAAGSTSATVAARLLVGTASDEAFLRSWLEAPPTWLVGDSDFRWLVADRLAAQGALADGELDAFERADPCVAGRLAALHARASVPTASAKAWAWGQLSGPESGHSNHELIALAKGLWCTSDPALTRPYVARFLDGIPAMAAWVGADALEKVVRFGFPRVVEPASVDLVDAALARPDLTPALRRAYVEWSWPLREAVASRRRWFG